MYPRLILDYDKLVHNTKVLVKKCEENGVDVMAVTKSYCAWDEAVEAVIEGGVKYVADSRIMNLKKIKQDIPKVLLRLPIMSEIVEVIKYCDISLNSNMETIVMLNEEAKNQGVIHKVILMFDLGDLREGIYYKEDYKVVVEEILNLSNIELHGIGTNLTCFGGIIPTKDTLSILEEIGKDIEESFNIELAIKSFGNSSSIYLLDTEDDYSYFNNLRLGECLILGRETSYGKSIEGLYEDVFTFEGQLIEVYDKPSLPEGKKGVNAFGEEVEFEDLGIIKRGILGFGIQDVDYNHLTPIDSNISFLGASSDHTIVELASDDYKVGSVVKFNLSYSSLLKLATSEYVYKEVNNGK